MSRKKTKQRFMCFAMYNPRLEKFMNDEPKARWTETPVLFFPTKKECEEYWDIGEVPKYCFPVSVSVIWRS